VDKNVCTKETVGKMMKNNETKSFCKDCGKCCTGYAGWYSPHQVLHELLLLAEGKLEGLGTKYQIDWYENNLDPIYTLRPAHTNSLGEEMDGSWGGTCVNLTKVGCSLLFDDRPFQCQSLVATAPRVCSSAADKETLADMWKPYQKYFKEYIDLRR